ncbi:hypothetical protein ART_3567 [Arthrobacter sp. PAMC 25486]|nr:hypothetical protein ART_3567 [Arthrobacter sp. PAMC 25486]
MSTALDSGVESRFLVMKCWARDDAPETANDYANRFIAN